MALASAAVGQDATARTSLLLSPNGRSLAYVVPAYDDAAEPATRIMVCKSDGSAPREVTVLPGSYSEVVWVGEDLLWCLSSADRRHVRWTPVTLAGERQPDVPLPDGCDVAGVTLSPDGRLAGWYGSYRPPDGEPKYGIVVADLASGEVRCLVAGTVKSSPGWSPDGKTIAVGEGGYQARYPLLLVDVATGRTTETGVDGVGCAWSPDGRFLALTTGALKGGGWYGGVPCDGRLGVLEVATGQLTLVSPEPVNRAFVDEGEVAMRGALRPVWSPDSQRLAYVWDTAVRRGGENQATCELWVVGRDGADSRKVLDRELSALVWARDGSAVLGVDSTKREVVRVDLRAAEARVLASWPEATIPDLPPVEAEIVERPGVKVSLQRVDRKYGEAFAAIISEARTVYKDVFGFSMPDMLTFEVTYNPKSRLALWTDGKSAFFLTVTSKQQLAPPTRGGPHNVYGVCHEMGHIAMYRDMEDLAGLPPGIGQGWAHYVGSVVVDEVAKRLGDAIWPEPFNVHEVDGLGRLEKQAAETDWAKLDDETAAAKLFYDAEKLHGRIAVGRAMTEAVGKAKNGRELMPAFVATLRELTGDPKAGEWIPSRLLESRLEWNVKERELPADFFADQRSEADDTGVTLLYDDGTSDGRWSLGGSGHAVLFQRPEGAWAIDRVSVFGTRYGPVEAPDKVFRIYVCGEDFAPIAEIARPQGTFDRTEEPRWYDIAIDPVVVPERFYVCITFNPTATDGVFVHYDSGVKRSHSRKAVPYSHVMDMDGNKDWMIRAHLVER